MPVYHWKGRLWQGMECQTQKDWASIRYEGNAQNKDYPKKEHPLSSQRARIAFQTQASFHREHVLRIPGSLKFILNHGLTRWWRFEISYGLSPTLQIK